MGRIPEKEIEALKLQVNLVTLIQSKGVELKRHGASDLVGHCPFHHDKTPSLVVTPSKNLWHCLGACQVGGTVIDWVMKSEGVSFRHAFELLRSGDLSKLSTPVIGPRNATIPKLTAPVEFSADDQTLMSQVIGYYHETLKTSPEALSYLAARGIANDANDEVITTFRLGYANRTLGLRLPDGNRGAGAAIRAKLQHVGLYRDTGHEHMNGSFVIPVIGEDGQITEVYGRKIAAHLNAGVQKHTYLPGPHRGVWNPAGLKCGEVILCEALIDALTFWVHGFRNVTASYGVQGFTEDHRAAFLANGVKKVWIAYDNDAAGNGAAVKLAESLKREGIESSRVLFPKGMDANEYALRVTPGRSALQAAISGVDLKVRSRPVKPWGSTPQPEELLEVARPEEPSSHLAAAPAVLAEAASTSQPAPIPEVPPVAATVSPAEVPTAQLPSALQILESETPTEIRGEDIWIRLGEREYRVRGLGKNLAFDALRVNVRVSQGGSFHIDTLDLYNAKARAAFIHAANREVGLGIEILQRDLGRVLLKLEALQEEQIRNVLEAAPKEKEPEMTEAEREEALSFLRSPSMLDQILSDFARCGIIGEETNKLVGYLAAVSRKLEDPLAIVIQSSSAAGKSSLMEAILAMMPREEKVQYSAMTGQSLFYMGEKDLKHKILAIAEEEGVHQASYALKLLQSEGEISIASTGKDPASGKLVTQEYRVEGPVMLFLTTTAIEIDEELLNRCLVLTVNEERDQTRAIHEMQRERQTIEGLLARRDRSKNLKRHQNAQRLLRPLLVANPYAKSLTFLNHRTRTRRDHMKYLTLIQSIALLHQYQRELKTAVIGGGEIIEYIEATLSDIETANRLCHQILGRSLDELAPQTRRLLGLIADWIREEGQRKLATRSEIRFTRKDVRAFTEWSDSQLQVHLTKLVDLEYVLVHRGGRGQNLVYELLWEGTEKASENARLMGLIETGKLASELEKRAELNYGTDEVQLVRRFRDEEEAIFGSSLPPLAPTLGPKLNDKSLGTGADRGSQENEPGIAKNAHQGVSPPDATEVPSYANPLAKVGRS